MIVHAGVGAVAVGAEIGAAPVETSPQVRAGIDAIESMAAENARRFGSAGATVPGTRVASVETQLCEEACHENTPAERAELAGLDSRILALRVPAFAPVLLPRAEIQWCISLLGNPRETAGRRVEAFFVLLGLIVMTPIAYGLLPITAAIFAIHHALLSPEARRDRDAEIEVLERRRDQLARSEHCPPSRR